MGCFSWCTSDTRKSIPCCIPFGDLPGTVYLLNPFGEPYKESNYNGYGVFGGRDVFDLVVEWNREHLSVENIRKPDRDQYQKGASGDAFFANAMENYNGLCEALTAYRNGASDDYMKEHFGPKIGFLADGSDWKRILGIRLSSYDREHVRLKYPIKIVEHPIPYENAGISPGCPFQGCIYPDSTADIQKKVNKVFADLAAEEEKYKMSRSLATRIQGAAGRAGTAQMKTTPSQNRDR